MFRKRGSKKAAMPENEERRTYLSSSLVIMSRMHLYGIVGIVDSRQRQHKSNSRLKNSILYSTPTRKKHVSVPSPKHSHFVHVVRDITCIICCCKIRTLQPNRCDSWCPSGNVFDESTNGPDEIVANVIRILKTQDPPVHSVALRTFWSVPDSSTLSRSKIACSWHPDTFFGQQEPH